MTDLEKAFQDKGELSSMEIKELSDNAGEELAMLVEQDKVKLETIDKNSIWKWM